MKIIFDMPKTDGNRKVYTILRKGSNTYNQERKIGWMPQMTVEAESKAIALEVAKHTVTLYSNQTLDAVTDFPRGFVRLQDASYQAN
jgi:hypothetical protein